MLADDQQGRLPAIRQATERAVPKIHILFTSPTRRAD